jgi:hypothetical protein
VAAVPALIARKEFRPPDVGTVVALVIAINQAVFALAPAILGSLREISANYTLSFAIAAIVQIMAALVIFLGKKRCVRSSGGFLTKRAVRIPSAVGQQRLQSTLDLKPLFVLFDHR